MRLSRRSFQRIMLGLTTLPFVARIARADDYPTHPVRLICGFPAGSGPDIVARIIAQGMSDRLGQSVVVENRPGAGGDIGLEAVINVDDRRYFCMLRKCKANHAGLAQRSCRDLACSGPVAATPRTRGMSVYPTTAAHKR